MKSGIATRKPIKAGRATLRLFPIAMLALLFCSAVISGVAARGQAAPAASAGPGFSRVDLYGGYAYFYPFRSELGQVPYPSVPLGAVGSLAGYFGNHLGLQLEGNYAPKGPADNNCVYTAQGGPILRAQYGRVVPFVHALGGGAVVGGPRAQTCHVWGWGVTGGGGLDIILPAFHDRLALRPIQVDFLYSHIDNGPVTAGGFAGGVGEIYAVRASAGIVLRLGNLHGEGHEPASLNCTAEPSTSFPGDPVTVSASTLNLNAKHKFRYLWSASGGHITGDGPTAAINTGSLMPGAYQVTGKLIDDAKKQRLVASCSASFTIQPYAAPTVACSADRAAIHSGDTVSILASASSPQNRPLTYSYTSSSGLVTGTGPNATLSTAGVSPGNITVTCKVMDDHGQTASASTGIVIANPPPPAPLPQMQSLCSISFDRDRRRPDRVDNEAKGCLDDVALTLNRESSAKLLIIGAHAANETNQDAAIRAMNAAQYLSQEKGIDPARLDLRTGPGNTRSAAMMLVPPGAVVEAGTASSFDTSSVKRSGQAYGKPGATRPRIVHRPKPAPRRQKATAAQFQ